MSLSILTITFLAFCLALTFSSGNNAVADLASPVLISSSPSVGAAEHMTTGQNVLMLDEADLPTGLLLTAGNDKVAFNLSNGAGSDIECRSVKAF